ncbi:MAG: DUF3987 domain-containing protein [Rhodothermales bacterium]
MSASAFEEANAKTAELQRKYNEQKAAENGHVNGEAAARAQREANLRRYGSTNPPTHHTDESGGPDLDLDGIRIPEALYQCLPKTLAGICDLIRKGVDRDVFLTASLPVLAGTMPNVRTKYGGHWQSLNVNVLVVAPASSGKARARDARRLGDRINQRMIEESEDDLQRWELEREEDAKEVGDRPPERSFYLAGDSSSAAFKERLEVNPDSVVFETEIKSMSIALGQDWGDFTDVILKSFHNEPVSSNRKGVRPIYIPHPAPSLFLSGTPGSLLDLISDTEDGKFSRFCIYTFESDPVWINQFEDEDDESLSDRIEAAAATLNDLHRELYYRNEPLYGRIDAEGREIINGAFARVLRNVSGQKDTTGIESNVKRGAMVAIRIALMIALLRQTESINSLRSPNNPIGGGKKSFATSTDDVRIGVILALVFLEHGLRISALFKSDAERDFTTKKKSFLASLPEGDFETELAVSIAKGMEIPRSTCFRYIKSFVNSDLLEKLDHGLYRSTVIEGGDTSEIIETIETMASTLPVNEP